MATLRQLFSYDDMEDADIHRFLKSLPERQKSKHIRMAIRYYISQTDQSNIPSRKVPDTPTEKQEKEINKNDFINVDDSILDLGK